MPIFVEEYIREIEEEIPIISQHKREQARAYIETELGIKEEKDE